MTIKKIVLLVGKYLTYQGLELRAWVSPVVLGNHCVKQGLSSEDSEELKYSEFAVLQY